jgi:methylase of polypeptide subunit release factors
VDHGPARAALDVGCGSATIAVTLLSSCLRGSLPATSRRRPLKVAEENARRLASASSCRGRRSNLFAARSSTCRLDPLIVAQTEAGDSNARCAITTQHVALFAGPRH